MPTTHFVARTRSHEQLYCRIHGVEQDGDNAFVAVMERFDGTAELADMPRLNLINQYYIESFRDPRLSAARRQELAEEHALVNDALGMLNDARIAAFPPPRAKAAFTPVAAASSFPASVGTMAEAAWQRFSGTRLAPSLKQGPVRS